MTRSSPLDIVIAGGGTAGWVAAATFARFLGNRASITLVESDEIGTVGVGEATIPQIHNLIIGLGLDQAEFLRATNGTFKLGIEFDGWSGEGSNYIHSFGYTGRGVGLIPFRQLWLRGRALGVAGDFGDYSFNIAAARLGRMSTNAGSGTLPDLAYAYHFDASLFAQDAARLCRGARRHARRGHDPRRRARWRERRHHRAAAQRRAAGGRQPVHRLHRLPQPAARQDAGRAAISTGASGCRAIPRSRCRASRATRSGPTPRRCRARRAGSGASRSSTAPATATSIAASSSPTTKRPRSCSPTSTASRSPTRGRSASPAAGARHSGRTIAVALGLAAGFMEPLESTSIHLVQSAVARLLNVLPGDLADARQARDNFNRLSAIEWARVRDFIVLHYFANDARRRRSGRRAATWGCPTACSARSSCSARPDCFMREEDELFLDDSWGQVMIGQGIMPQSWSPLADNVPGEDIGPFLETLAKSYQLKAEALPTHRAVRRVDGGRRGQGAPVMKRIAVAHAGALRSRSRRRSHRQLPAARIIARGLPEDEVIYFVLPDRFENGDPSNDRGGLSGDRLATGFDPTRRASTTAATSRA